MKARMAWLWTLTYACTGCRIREGLIEGNTATPCTCHSTPKWHGTCPKWAAQPVPEGATLTKERVMVVGKSVPCGCCGGAHPDL